MDVAGVAKTTEQFVEGFMKIEPLVATGAMFIPGAQPVMAVIHPAVVMAAPFVERALTSIAANNGGDAFGALIELLQHISVGHPNSPILSNIALPGIPPAGVTVASP